MTTPTAHCDKCGALVAESARTRLTIRTPHSPTPGVRHLCPGCFIGLTLWLPPVPPELVLEVLAEGDTAATFFSRACDYA